jgi:SH3-like domain-containing protein
MHQFNTAFLTFLILCFFTSPLYSADKFLSIQVRQGQVRTTPSFLGNVSAVLDYGDKVKIIEDKGAWKKISFHKTDGWMHSSALTTKTISVQAGKSDVKTGTSKSELSLAGKGFNSKVEAEFKSRNKNIDYTWVDRMEKYDVPPGQMQAFLKQGLITPSEEVAP